MPSLIDLPLEVLLLIVDYLSEGYRQYRQKYLRILAFTSTHLRTPLLPHVDYFLNLCTGTSAFESAETTERIAKEFRFLMENEHIFARIKSVQIHIEASIHSLLTDQLENPETTSKRESVITAGHLKAWRRKRWPVKDKLCQLDINTRNGLLLLKCHNVQDLFLIEEARLEKSRKLIKKQQALLPELLPNCLLSFINALRKYQASKQELFPYLRFVQFTAHSSDNYPLSYARHIQGVCELGPVESLNLHTTFLTTKESIERRVPLRIRKLTIARCRLENDFCTLLPILFPELRTFQIPPRYIGSLSVKEQHPCRCQDYGEPEDPNSSKCNECMPCDLTGCRQLQVVLLNFCNLLPQRCLDVDEPRIWQKLPSTLREMTLYNNYAFTERTDWPAQIKELAEKASEKFTDLRIIRLSLYQPSQRSKYLAFAEAEAACTRASISLKYCYMSRRGQTILEHDSILPEQESEQESEQSS